MLGPALQSEGGLAGRISIGGDLMPPENATPESIQAFRDEKTANIRMLVQERGSLQRLLLLPASHFTQADSRIQQ